MRYIIHEPSTFFTNLPILIMATFFGFEIWSFYDQTSHPFYFNVGCSFYSLSVAAMIGAFFHGFGPYFKDFLRERIWKFALIGIGFTSFFNLMAAVAAIVSAEYYATWCWILAIGLALFIRQTVKFQGFGHSIKFIAVAVILTLIAFCVFAWRNFEAGPLNLLLSNVLTAASGVLWTTRWSINERLNHNDLFHLIQLISLWLTYQGAMHTTLVQLP